MRAAFTAFCSRSRRQSEGIYAGEKSGIRIPFNDRAAAYGQSPLLHGSDHCERHSRRLHRNRSVARRGDHLVGDICSRTRSLIEPSGSRIHSKDCRLAAGKTKARSTRRISTQYLSVGLEDVRELFARYELLDEQVRFLKGWFRDTLPQAPIRKTGAAAA